ncbi:acylneuraminate cytidylyltransferase [Caldicellulosiruptor acetigenus]|uniref:N-acylneuraminate cytidylyltransferase n=1 Tax=Caldicellulosiruptor acetigenus 6A TaxID=632516 RepID=G2PVZ1_9FIRM|nr:acylneuraminate cytidylyltransferase [Caldicellulosiruptor acetigenus]AEM73709.1 3-deoxy-D-manno-octulosonate 8-phosphate phosphatase, YrbI family [Caldicellulosiruptor acetigenus 6A]
MESHGGKIIAFIPARGGSKSIPLKNIKLLNNRPLIYYALDAAVGCKYIKSVYVSTDSQQIKECVQNYKSGKVKIVGRSPETATDEATTESVILDFIYNYCEEEFDYLVLIQATSPFLESKHLDEAIEKYFKTNCDSMLSVVRQKRFIWDTKGNYVVPVNYDPAKRPRRQEFKGFLVENGAFYITSKVQILKSKCRISGKISYYEMPEYSYFEIDEIEDWFIVETLISKIKRERIYEELREKVNKIKLLAMDCDGVLTDGGMYYSEKGEELKKFNTRDGMGISIVKKAGILTAIITSEDSEIVRRRAEKIGIDYVFLGIKNKLDILFRLVQKIGISLNEVAYIGDDINDIDVLKNVGFSIAPNDASEEVKKIVDYVTVNSGGNGVVREICDMICLLKAD